MSLPDDILEEIRSITSGLIKLGLSDDQKFPSDKVKQGNIREVGFGDTINLSVALKNIPYSEIYDELSNGKMYNIRLIDGGLIQFSYMFEGDALCKHRLAYFSSPHLESYQVEPEIYEEDEIYADFVMRNIVSFPIRFDYDSSDEKHVLISHPKSHLTLGQYLNCRIPVCSPLMPSTFILFILRNFYNTAYSFFNSKLCIRESYMPPVIGAEEEQIPHLRLVIREA